MTPSVIALGELLVEVMRKEVDCPLSAPGELVGPFPSGAPAIFIDAVARLGAPAGFVGVVGADDFGECVTGRLREDGVDTARIRTVPGHTTGIAFVAYAGDGSRHFVFHLPQSAAALLAPDDVNADYVAGAQFLHVTGSALSISESARQACYRAAEIARRSGVRISFDPNLRPELMDIDRVRAVCRPVLEVCHLLLPSGAEASMLTGDDDPMAACRRLVAGGIPIVALKQGEQGSTVFSADGALHVPSQAVTEIDPTGAGDCYGGAFVVGLLEGWDLQKVARFANIAGALSVTRKGPMEGIPRRADVLEQMGRSIET